MADKERDNPDYTKDIMKHDAKHAFEGATIATLISGIFAVPIFAVSSLVMTFDYNGTRPDPDLYTGFLDDQKNFSYVIDDRYDDFEHGTLMLIRHDNGDGYALYKADSEDSERLVLMDRDGALQAMQTVSERIEQGMQDLENRNLNPLDEYRTYFRTDWQAEEVSLPYVFNNQVERIHPCRSAYNSVYNVQSLSGEELRPRLAEELALWQEAMDKTATDPNLYGVNDNIIMDQANHSFGSVFIQNMGIATPTLLGVLGGFALLGGSLGLADGRRRRQKDKQQKLKHKR